MVKSTASCFKIITCGSDSVDHDDLQAPESKGSSGRGWSFRKRSARHRVLSNTVISESVNKENSDSTAVNFQPQANKESSDSNPVSFHPQHNLTVPEKTSAIQITEEKIEVFSQPEPEISDYKAAEKDEYQSDSMLDESIVIVIQAGIRGLLAQRLLLKQKNIIKLQAAVRGHLVRRHAVGTLRCVQAIVKMQALIRAHHARVLVVGSSDIEKQSENNGNHNHESSERRAKPQVTYSYISIEKLLSNRFARQLMESTPRGQPINIKCDPLKSDSAWKWLERWMAVSSPSYEEPHDSRLAELQYEKENTGCSEGKNDVLVTSNSHSELTVLISSDGASAEASINDDKLIDDDENNMDIQTSKSTTPESSQTKWQHIDESHSTYDINESAPIETNETELISDMEAKAPQTEDKTESDTNLPDLRTRSAEQPETEDKKLSRKASNSFIAAQSKFQELSSTGPSAKLTTSSSLDLGVESTLDKVSSPTDQTFSSKEIELSNNSISNASVVQNGGSECGTELSISSTLDSPDRSEIEVNQLEQEPKITDVTDHPSSSENLGIETNGESIMLETDPDDTITRQLERCETVNSVTGELERYDSVKSVTGELERCETVDLVSGESVSSTIVVDSPQLSKETEAIPCDLHLELESEATHLVDQLSPAASPKSHITIPESQTTPSSQVSVKTKKSKSEKSGPSHKKKSSSAERKSHSNPNQDSGSRSGVEQKEHKSGKRRNSFGSAKHDADQEPRDSNSSISLPSYMQATESARAKLTANASPRSSPDVHDKDMTIKKRHSLPGTNGRQGSPHIQRSLSQAQQNAKGNGEHSPQDRKWRR